MKKFHFLAVAILLAVFCFGCASSGSPAGGIDDAYYVAPDPANPLTGTWHASIAASGYMHVIDGMNGTYYMRGGITGWLKTAVYAIEKNGNEYRTSNNWRMVLNGNTLAVENMAYERVTKK